MAEVTISKTSKSSLIKKRTEMNKIILTLATAMLSNCLAWAQPEVNASNVAQNFTAEFLFSQADGFDPGNAGANQTWDFSGLNLMQVGTDAVLPVAGSPYAATFPNANYVYKFSGQFGSDRYYYHILSNNKFEMLSLAYGGSAGDNYTLDPRTLMEFPYNFNDTYTDTYRTTADVTIKNVVATYDAYGTVIMPYGTFENVVRQKVVTNGVTDYIWWNVAPFYPIVQTVLAENSLGITKSTTVLGVPGNEIQEMALYPNPTAGEVIITVEDADPLAEICVFNTMGKLVLRQKNAFSAGNSTTLNLQNQPAGIYFLNIMNGAKATAVKKIVKK
jgi:hypothetical protein